MLSKREKEVLRLIAAGATDAEAAERLGVSKSTVQTHIYSMLQKTGARSRGHLISMALRERWLEDDGITK